MILAAGFGTRLRPLTLELPKPLVWIGDRPAIGFAVDALARGGVVRAVLNTHALAEQFTRERLAAFAMPLSLVHEAEILGTAGGVAHAYGLLGPGDVVIWNGDLVCDLDVGALFDRHRASGAEATLAVAPRAFGQGTVGVSASGDIVRLRGERFGVELFGGDFMGAHVVSERLRMRLPRQGCMAGDVYLPALRRGARLATYRHNEGFSDIGTVAAYLDANQRWLRAQSKESYAGPNATIASEVSLARSVVGAGARVSGKGSLIECVVWPGAHAVAPLRRSVVTERGVVGSEHG